MKNGRLFERSEFLPFSKTGARSSPGDSALDFFLLVSFLFAARQKEKYTDKLSFLFAIILLSRELGKCRAYNVSKWKLYVPWC